MPYKARKPCAHRGCPNLVNARYCPRHTKAEATRYNRYGRDRERDKSYGKPWKQIRAAYLAAHPLCEMCQSEGRLIPATLVHHKVKLTDGGTNGWENLMPLCGSCHSRLHAKYGDYFKNPIWSRREGL